MDLRQQRGLKIAQTSRITKNKGDWIVPSQNGNGTYTVTFYGFKPKCTCPDCKMRRTKCKHIWAVEYFKKKEIDMNGNERTTEAVRVTYSQNWHSYNLAQNKEIELFGVLLKDLVQYVEEPEQKRGRPRLSLQESLFCAIEKVYSQLSSRRAHTLYREAREKEQIGRAPNFNAINKFLNREDTTPILHDLLIFSALPLKDMETQFAIDSSGFDTKQFNQYLLDRHKQIKYHDWVKAHVLVGVKTNIILNAKITDGYSNDSPQLVPLLLEVQGIGFDVKEVSADKAYSSDKNLNFIHRMGSVPYIPFRSNTSTKTNRSEIWKKMYHFFRFHEKDFLEHYHKRSNVETVFMMIKTKFGERLKTKNRVAQTNELYCKLIAHNIVVLIHEMMEVGFSPTPFN